jgi:hypothetical protein
MANINYALMSLADGVVAVGLHITFLVISRMKNLVAYLL